MKRKTLILLSVLTLSFSMASCGKDDTPAPPSPAPDTESVVDTETESPEDIGLQEVESREGMYRSELTNEWIDEELKDQRPIAVMVDNESIALPHYGLTEADVVYEMMNSTANGRITRLMALVKDWETLEQFGSIRSARPTNFLLAAEWNAMLVHDGGPVYIDDYVKQPYTNNLSGGFSRIKNGKPTEYTEYICTGDLDKRIDAYGYSTEYNDYYEGEHYNFASENNPIDLSTVSSSIEANKISFPFPHNKSMLTYDEDTQLYYYSEYGDAHLDPQNGNAQLCFKNVLIQNCNFMEFDNHGYMMFYIINSDRQGYYITNGHAIKVTWEKTSATSPTRYYDESGNEITLNTGKTYIGIVPDDNWSSLSIE